MPFDIPADDPLFKEARDKVVILTGLSPQHLISACSLY